MKNGPVLLTLAALGGLVILMVRMDKLEQRIRAMEQGAAPTVPQSAVSAAPQPEVAVYMGRIQVYMHKLYWAGMAKNLPLADFYRHEIKEVMEELAKAGIKDGEIDISRNIQAHGISSLDAMKAHLRTKGLEGFGEQYGLLVNACNACHVASEQPMIRVQVPTENRYTDQVFVP